MRRWHLVGSTEERRGNAAAAFAAFDRMNAEVLADAPPLRGPSYRAAIDGGIAGWTAEWAKGWTADFVPAGVREDPFFSSGPPGLVRLFSTSC